MGSPSPIARMESLLEQNYRSTGLRPETKNRFRRQFIEPHEVESITLRSGMANPPVLREDDDNGDNSEQDDPIPDISDHHPTSSSDAPPPISTQEEGTEHDRGIESQLANDDGNAGGRPELTGEEAQMLQIFEDTDPCPLYSESVEKQNRLVLKTYSHFCNIVKREMWPLDAKVTVAYIRVRVRWPGC